DLSTGSTNKQDLIREAIRHASILVEQNPRRVPGREALYIAKLRLAAIYLASSRVNDGLSLYEQALEVLTSLSGESRFWYRSGNQLHDIRRIYSAAVKCLHEAHRDDEAKQWVNRYADWLQGFQADAPADSKLQSGLWECQVQLVDLLHAFNE